jgi:stress response protein YsnF
MGKLPDTDKTIDLSAIVDSSVDSASIADASAKVSTSLARGLAGRSEVIPILAETLEVSKRSVTTGRVRVSTYTETREESAEIELDRTAVDVVRVPVGRVVDEVPKVRNEGSTTIVPVVEERLVVVKQIFLKEELHIRHAVTRETVRQPVELRQQRAVIEHLDADGHILDPEGATSHR